MSLSIASATSFGVWFQVTPDSESLIAFLTTGGSATGASGFFFCASASVAGATTVNESAIVSSAPKSLFAFMLLPPPWGRGFGGLPHRDRPPHRRAGGLEYATTGDAGGEKESARPSGG